jgi:N-acetylneuraminic acid mutarotase
VLAVGGNFAASPVRVVESLPCEGKPASKVISWSVPSPSEARQGQAVAVVRSKLLAIGGNRSDQPHAFGVENLMTQSVELSSARADGRRIDPLPEPRQSGALITVSSRKSEAFLIGGIGPDGEVSRTLGDVFRLDLATGKWSKLSTVIPDQRGLFGTAVYKDSVYLFGGSVWDPRPGHDPRTMTTDVLRWDCSTEGAAFEPIGTKSPRTRRSFATAVLGSKCYLIGGLNDQMKLVDEVDVFDFETHEWSTAPSPPQPRLFAEMAALDGKLYLAGGVTRTEGGSFAPARSIDCFDPATGQWSTAVANSIIDGPGVAVVAIQGRLLLYAPARSGEPMARFAIVAP